MSGASGSNSSGSEVPGSPTHGELSGTVAMQSKQLLTLVKLVERKSHATDSKAELIESLANTIERISFDPDNDGTFDACYARFEDVLCKDTKALYDAGKVRLLLHRLDSMAHQRYCHYILPALPRTRSLRRPWRSSRSCLRSLNPNAEAASGCKWPRRRQRISRRTQQR